MKHSYRTLLAGLFVTALAMALANSQVTRGAGITVTATLLEPGGLAGDTLTFRLQLDTHSGDLMAYDLSALAVLRTSEGMTVEGGFAWQGEGDASHHRQGVLEVAAVQAGAPLITAATTYVELELKDIGVSSRLFRWEAEALTKLQATGVPPGAGGTSGNAEALTSLQETSVGEAGYVYLPAIADGTVVALDPTSLEVAWTLQVSQGSEERGPESAMGIASSPDGGTVYTGDAAKREVVVVDADTQEIIATIGLDHGIHAVDLSPDGRYLWVDGRLEDYNWLSATSIIDTESMEITQTLSPGLGSAAHLSFTPDGLEVWAASVTTNLVWVWNAASGEVLAAIPLTRTPLEGATPEGQAGQLGFNEVAISPDGSRAYAVGPETSLVYAIEVASRQVLGTVQAGERAHGIAVTPAGAEVWTANRDGTITIIDAGTLQVVETLDVAPYANHVAFGSEDGLAYVSRQDDVAVIDVVSRELVATIPVGSEPHEFSLKGARSARPAAADE